MDLMLDSTKSKPYLNSEPIINPSIPTSKILFSTRFQQRLHSINFSILDTNFQPVESKTQLNQVKNSRSIQFIFICTVLQKPYLSLPCSKTILHGTSMCGIPCIERAREQSKVELVATLVVSSKTSSLLGKWSEMPQFVFCFHFPKTRSLFCPT